MSARVLVVEHQGNAGIGLLSDGLAAGGAELVVVGPDAGRPLPKSLAGFEALIVLGGSMGPEDDAEAPWLPDARALLAEGVANGTPTLGICLGAQLLAVATGGVVATLPGGPEIGLCTASFAEAAPRTAGDPVLGPLAGTEPPVVQWHYLEIAELPPGAELLASSDACRHQAFRLGEAAWGVQFHPEATTPTAEAWVLEDADGLERLGRAAEPIVTAVRDAEPELRRHWGALAERFATLAAAGAAARGHSAA
ncbi:type 1 glutamine amidotransferase [Leucobacter allii]|uniref:Type 1 glutamine amidotransferase n=1 Tax=Leucobacter allii TaxID=2932247 RepID=A0ABY4FP41_9MICO|nr:type 1 glutamine amidotransferase [Leucobacter allii]UOQ58052.1 type 1 glutamine amidotransferase [Leucobacter allii]